MRQTRLIDPAHNYTTQLQGAYVNADEALLRQALRVLVDNARKYTPDGGNIRIAVSDGEQWVSLVVQDDGIGIPPQALPHIFDRFYRADESRARATGGNGLGLSIAKWVVDRHGGQIEVLSRQDLGTRFTILLPRTAPPAPGDEP
ncbi:Alkaline phosphatase synthesis sensor protein PhoR [bioreactor metagenome]|uniref:histidine kinase n=1 Tax=bioreactor metagenome TaxID=1076179 RepID=A0A645BIB5_9ZZZZ